MQPNYPDYNHVQGQNSVYQGQPPTDPAMYASQTGDAMGLGYCPPGFFVPGNNGPNMPNCVPGMVYPPMNGVSLNHGWSQNPAMTQQPPDLNMIFHFFSMLGNQNPPPTILPQNPSTAKKYQQMPNPNLINEKKKGDNRGKKNGDRKNGKRASPSEDRNRRRSRSRSGGKRKRPPITKRGDWICPEKNCGNVNFSYRNRCNKCNMQKPEERQYRNEEVRNKGKHQFKDDDWKCSSCSNINFNYRDKCNRCGKQKSGDDKTQVELRIAKTNRPESSTKIDESVKGNNEYASPDLKDDKSCKDSPIDPTSLIENWG